jgi:serine/threonine protein kinase
MALTPGSKLGPYEIQSPLGAGGMGEVYRARDARLNREVAIKVLPVAFARDSERLRRFQQEAQAVAALNHPNILAIYDFGEHEDSPYIVTELLEGETLRERMRPGVLPVRKATEYAKQVARGLAAAHEKGIVHRDLKPENILVTREGRVKILDFGLAKLTQANAAPEDGPTVTLQERTDPGVVMGTIGYMSPEQVKGQNADPRSDLFSFGAILYEMLSGKRAFHGDNSVETLNAILKQDPPEFTKADGTVPPALERIARHCLEKNPEERFQSARDVAFYLTNLLEISGSSTALRASKTRPPWRIGLIAVASVLAGLIAGTLLWRREPNPAPVFSRLTYQVGNVDSARFSPDGHTVVYSAAWNGLPLQLFSTRAEFPQPQPLGIEGARVRAVSASNQIAVVLHPGTANSTLALASLSGGASREVLQNVRDATWGPDGELAIVRMANGRDRLEYPAGKVLYETAGWISDPGFSKKGDQIAFLEHATYPDSRGSVALVDLKGRKQTLTREWYGVDGLAWSAADNEIWFSGSKDGHSSDLYGVTRSGRQRLVLDGGPSWLGLRDIASDGRVLLYTGEGRSQAVGRAAGATREQDLSWREQSYVSDISADGQWIAFTEADVFEGEIAAGHPEYLVAIRKLDGSSPVKLGEGNAGRFSPDGKWVSSWWNTRPPKVTLLPTGAGDPRSISLPEIDRIAGAGPGFFPDAQHLWLNAAEPGHSARAYVLDVRGGKPHPVTPEGVLAQGVSPDGKSLIVTDLEDRLVLLPTDGGSARTIPGLEPGLHFVQWGPGGESIYVQDEHKLPNPIVQVDLRTGHKRTVRQLAPADASEVVPVNGFLVQGVNISPDGESYAYWYFRASSRLFVVKGLK